MKSSDREILQKALFVIQKLLADPNNKPTKRSTLKDIDRSYELKMKKYKKVV